MARRLEDLDISPARLVVLLAVYFVCMLFGPILFGALGLALTPLWYVVTGLLPVPFIVLIFALSLPLQAT